RHEYRITWPVELVQHLIAEAAEKHMGVLKIHSHPGGFDQFSEVDDRSDSELFPSIHTWTEDGFPHASAVMLPCGRIFGRVHPASGAWHALDRVAVAGDDILFFDHDQRLEEVTEDQLRTAQAFGPGTVSRIRRLTIGVVGASGTGGWVIEQLARLGARLVLVDHDRVERKNLNRIVETVLKDAESGRPKVEVFAERAPGFGTHSTVEPYIASALDREVADRLAECDVIFGCVDSLEGRDVLNRIATFYTIPFFDVGVLLRADGKGGVNTICGSVHYLVPGGSSLLSRGVYTPEDLAAETLKRTDPEQYEAQRKEGYIRGVRTESPAVISINGLIASAAVNEFLARIHRFRLEQNCGQRWQLFDLINCAWTHPSDGRPCPLLAKRAGRGDLVPFLDCNLVTEARYA
ncbi:MAG TPA: ThiF family adenylyltransferase, partial [Chthoniobacteraceae bacterium]|nr:ThiF family adenylyltransferase [Chthoniobacteraceae bacterium]